MVKALCVTSRLVLVTPRDAEKTQRDAETKTMRFSASSKKNKTFLLFFKKKYIPLCFRIAEDFMGRK